MMVKRRRRWTRASRVLLWLCLIVQSTARAHEWTGLYSFGDSYTDSGAGFVDGNGPTAVVYLARTLGVSFTYAGDPSAAGKSLNFAVSGAQTGKSDGFHVRSQKDACGVNEALFGRGMQTQVLDFVHGVQTGDLQFDPQRTLFFLAGGLNDWNLTSQASVAHLEGEIRQIYRAGGRYFLVALLPKKIPQFSQRGVRLDPAIARIPRELSASLPGAHLKISRWGYYFDRVLEKPAEYGIKNTTERCAGRAVYGEDPTPCSSPNTHFYYTEGHPSTGVQKIVASQLAHEVAELFP